MKVLLIDPPGYQEDLNLGLVYLGTALKQAGCQVLILDLNNNKRQQEKRLRKALKTKPLVVGISVKLFTLKEVQKIIDVAKQFYPAAFYLAGGPHVTVCQGKVFREIPQLDALVVGEGERVLVRLCKQLEQKKRLLSGQGLFLKKDAHLPMKAYYEAELDLLPLPNYSIYEMNLVLRKKIAELLKNYPLITSRGCPYGCIYCSVGLVSGRKWRARSVESLIDELVIMKKKYSINQFRVLDDNFTQDKERIKQFCQGLIDKKLNLKWYCPNGVRADKIDLELARLMYQSGCYSVMVGIESGHPEVLKNVNKGTTLEVIAKGVRIFQEVGIKVGGFFIIGLPGSTFKRELKSIEFAQSLKLDSSFWSMLVPYPGTKLWIWLEERVKQKNAKMLRDFREGFHFGGVPPPIFETKNFSEAERKRAYIVSCLRNWKINLVKEPGETSQPSSLFGKFIKMVWRYDRRRLPVYFKELLFLRGPQFVFLKLKHQL